MKRKVVKTELGMTTDQVKFTNMLWSTICQTASHCGVGLNDVIAAMQVCNAMLIDGGLMALKSEFPEHDKQIAVRKHEEPPDTNPSEYFNE